jgi:hypothetical protein
MNELTPAKRLWRTRAAMFSACLIVLCSSRANGQNAEFTQNTGGSTAIAMEARLGNFPGRVIRLPLTLQYSTRGLWRVGYVNCDYENVSIVHVQLNAEAIYAEYTTAGWTTSLDIPSIDWTKLNDKHRYAGKSYGIGYDAGRTFRIARLFVHLPDGSTHELRKADAVHQDTGQVGMTVAQEPYVLGNHERLAKRSC